jgi:hypothetical protein
MPKGRKKWCTLKPRSRVFSNHLIEKPKSYHQTLRMHKIISQGNTFFQGLDLCAMVAALQSNRLGVLITQGERGLSIGQACGICMPSRGCSRCTQCAMLAEMEVEIATVRCFRRATAQHMADVRGERLDLTSDLPALTGSSLFATLSNPPCAACPSGRLSWIAACRAHAHSPSLPTCGSLGRM